MLINALCQYYDILSEAGKVLPDGYSYVKTHYIISLTSDGKIDEFVKHKTEDPNVEKQKKVRFIPIIETMPKRTEKSKIDANIIEHRPLYIFGLNFDGKTGTFKPDDRTEKAKKSHKVFVEANLEFLEGLDSPLINAYRQFVEKWDPEDETENADLLKLGKEYAKSGFAFCLSGRPDKLLHNDPLIKEKWEKMYEKGFSDVKDGVVAQCSVTGKKAPIARIHNKIKGVYGGLATGSVLVGFNNESENSYGNEQSYNSNISEVAMKKYAEALNYLLSDNKHKVLIDDMTVVFWAMNSDESCEGAFMSMLMGTTDGFSDKRTEEMLEKMLNNARNAYITKENLTLDGVDPNVDFYMFGLKPNSSRLSLKFIIRKKFADVLWNIARFQNDMQITKEIHPVPLYAIKKEFVSPKSSNQKVNPALMAKLFEKIIYGMTLPDDLLDTVVRRVRTDSDIGRISQQVRMGLIKACVNRKENKEELKVSLDKSNHDQAYLCGRLFAVLEKLQQEASNNSLNRTIKDSYFASASAKPVLVFPKLLDLAQNHLKKVKYPVYYNKLIGEIIDNIDGEFPEMLSLKNQGKFIIGYYQQYQSFFEKNEKNNLMEEE